MAESQLDSAQNGQLVPAYDPEKYPRTAKDFAAALVAVQGLARDLAGKKAGSMPPWVTIQDLYGEAMSGFFQATVDYDADRVGHDGRSCSFPTYCREYGRLAIIKYISQERRRGMTGEYTADQRLPQIHGNLGSYSADGERPHDVPDRSGPPEPRQAEIWSTVEKVLSQEELGVIRALFRDQRTVRDTSERLHWSTSKIHSLRNSAIAKLRVALSQHAADLSEK